MKKLKTTILYDAKAGQAWISLQGKLCGMDAMQFKSRMIRFIDETSSDIIIDLRSLDGIDLTGANSLAMIYKDMRDRRFDFRLIGSEQSPAMALLRDTKLSRILPITYNRV